MEFKDQVFAAGVLMWGYDKLDQMLRIDITSGWVEDVLLDAELGAMNVTGDEGGSDLVGRSAMVGRSGPGRALGDDRAQPSKVSIGGRTVQVG